MEASEDIARPGDTALDDTADSLERAPRTVAGYRLIARIGRGGQADVFAAARLADGVRVAVKLLPDPSPTALERLRREATAAARLDHPNVVRVHEFGSSPEDDCAFIAMELLMGESLADRLARGPLDLDLTFHILRGIGAALEAAHALGIVHRDLKPANVFLTGPSARPTVKVMDFGIARFDERWDATRLTATGALVGTPHFMSPEQILGTEGLTAASDVYALGVIAYRMITGQLPFPGPSVQQVLTAHLSAHPPEAPLRERVPPRVADAVVAALAKGPRDRPASVQALIAELPGAARKPRTGLAWAISGLAIASLALAAALLVTRQHTLAADPASRLAAWASGDDADRAAAYAYALEQQVQVAADPAAMVWVTVLLDSAQPAGSAPYNPHHRIQTASYLGTLGHGSLLLTIERVGATELSGIIESADPKASGAIHGFWRGNHAILAARAAVFELAVLDDGATIRGTGPGGAPVRATRR